MDGSLSLIEGMFLGVLIAGEIFAARIGVRLFNRFNKEEIAKRLMVNLPEGEIDSLDLVRFRNAGNNDKVVRLFYNKLTILEISTLLMMATAFVYAFVALVYLFGVRGFNPTVGTILTLVMGVVSFATYSIREFCCSSADELSLNLKEFI